MSEIREELGKIKSIKFGFGGYQGAQFGVTLLLGGESWGVGDFWGHWGIEPSSGAEWTAESRNKELGEVSWRVRNLIKSAKVQTIDQLIDIPVRVRFKNFNSLDSWEVLKEVL